MMNSTEQAVRFALVGGRAQPQARVRELPWPGLAQMLTTHSARADQDGPGFVPAQFREGLEYRKAENVEALTMLVLDMDDGTPFEEFRPRLEGYAYVAHSTFRSTPTHPRYRVVLPLARPVPASEWPEFWERATAYFAAGQSDAACKNPDRFYYLPSYPPGADPWSHYSDGAWLDPASVPAVAKPEAPRPVATTAPRAMGSARVSGEVILERALAGEFNVPPGRNNLGFAIAQQFRDNGYTEAEAEPFLMQYQRLCPSMDAQGRHEPYTEEDAQRTLRSAYSKPARDPWQGSGAMPPRTASGKASGSLVPEGRGFEDFEDFVQGTVTGDWTPPLPFRDHDLPALPTDALPAGLRRYVEAEAVATQVPAELVAALAIPAVALALAKKVEVCPKPGWWEPVNVWFLCVTKPGSRSSQVRRNVAAPIVEHERGIREKAASRIAMEAASHEVKKRRLARAMDQAAKCDDDMERQRYEGEAKDLARELDQMRLPVPPRLLVDDVTPEKLTSMMAEQGGKMGLLSSEGGIFGMMAGRYSKDGEPNLEIYLKGHAGDDHTVDRGSRGSEHISKPALTLGVRIQPSVLGELARKPGFRGVGLLGRWAYLLPKDTLGARAVNPPPVPEDVAAGYAETLRRLLAIPDAPVESGVSQGRALRFSNAARRTLDGFQMWLEPQLGEWGELGAMTDWAGKLAGLVVRLSGLLHVWRYAETHASVPGESLKPWEAEVTAETVTAAIRIGKCLIPHARAAFVQMGADPAIADARHILGWIQRSGQGKFAKRDLWQSMRRSGRFQRVEEMQPALRLLIDHGYIREEASEGVRVAGRPSVSFEVNPLAQNPQNPQNPPLQARGEEVLSGGEVTEWEEGEV